MRTGIILWFAWLACMSCKTKISEEHHEVMVMADSEGKPVWEVYGNEPFWHLYIHEDTALYTRLNENIDSVYLAIHHYNLQDSVAEFHFTAPGVQEASLVMRREKVPCSDGMSDKEYAYSAVFMYKQEILKGCAEMK
jgi:uncharacterized membrane protein